MKLGTCDLGVLIDDELKWTTHIDTVVQKLQRVMGICYNNWL